jgi:hypothetical protein
LDTEKKISSTYLFQFSIIRPQESHCVVGDRWHCYGGKERAIKTDDWNSRDWNSPTNWSIKIVCSTVVIIDIIVLKRENEKIVLNYRADIAKPCKSLFESLYVEK